MPLTCIHSEEIRLWKNIESQCKVAFDVGVNDISHLAHFQTWTTDLYLFEPNFSCFSSLVKLYPNAKVINTGLGDLIQNVSIYRNSMSIFKRSICNDGEAYASRVDTLDNFCRANHIPAVDFIKVDAEGYDGRTLLGGREIVEIVKMCKWIQIENFFIIETDQIVKDNTVRLIKDMGWHVYHMRDVFTKIKPEDIGNYPEYCNFLLSKEEYDDR